MRASEQIIITSPLGGAGKPPTPPVTPDLDFSKATNSQYLILGMI